MGHAFLQQYRKLAHFLLLVHILVYTRSIPHKGDAFALKPSDFDQVDWLFSDIICYPEKLFEWLSIWVNAKKCKNFVSTIKFQGTPDYSIARKFLEFEGSQVVHLYNNKHELTFIHKE